MKKVLVLLAVAVMTPFFLSTPCLGEEREVIFSDDFKNYTATQPADMDKELAKKWSVFAGHWYVKDGTLHQDAGSFDYGLVARDIYLRCDYRIDTKVRLVGGGAGAGFYWNIFNQVTGDSGNMLRYDGNNPIMYGWMTGRYFFGTGGATGNLVPDGQWHDFSMDIKNSTGTFDIYWDGKKVADGALEYHRSGYVGLQCSLGHCEWDFVKISVAKGTDWHASPAGKVNPEWVSSLALLPDGNIVYPVPNMHRLQIVTPEGMLIREFGKFGEAPGEMKVPMAVVTDKDGKIYVAEYENDRVQIFDADGKSIKVIAPSGKNALKNPLGVALVGGKVWVADSGNERLVCLNDDGTVAVSIGATDPKTGAFAKGTKPGEFDLPWQVNAIDGKLYVSDSNNHRVQIFDPANPTAAPTVIPLGLPMSPHSVAFNGKNFYVSNGQYLTVYDPQWKLVKEFRGTYANNVAAEQVVFDKSGNLLVADAWNKRLVFLAPALTEVKPKVSDRTADAAVITWTSDLPTATKVVLVDTKVPVTMPGSVDYSNAQRCGDGQLTTDHRVELKGLKNATRHTYAIVSPTRTIPIGGNSKDYRFATEAPAGMMAYSEMKVAVLCYGNVTFESQKDAKTGKVPAPVVRDEKWFEGPAVKQACEAVRYFYLTNSRFRFDTHFIYKFVTRPVDFAYLGSSSEEVYKDLAELAAGMNLQPSDFSGVVTIGGNGTYAYPWPTPWWGGKLTYTTGCCFSGGGGMWIIEHEFHHVTEGWMYQCGVDGFDGASGYNCADVPWGHSGRFGENDDFLAHTLRWMPPEAYVSCPFGTVKVTADKDGDGVPDNEPNLVWDEKRAGTDPNNKFSYGNGLTDLQNIAADNFTSTDRTKKNPLLRKEVDFKFPFAVFDYNYDRPKKSPKIDGHFTETEWDLFAQTPNVKYPKNPNPILDPILSLPAGTDCRMKTYLNWDDENLYIAISAPYKFTVGINLDCNADGYFHGKDNVNVGFSVPRDETAKDALKANTAYPTAPAAPGAPPLGAVGVMVWNNVEPVPLTGYPGWTNELFTNKDKIKWAWGKNADGWYFITIAMPKTEAVGLVPADGKEMGVRFWCKGLLPVVDAKTNPDPGFVFEMFDTCEYGQFKLVK